MRNAEATSPTGVIYLPNGEVYKQKPSAQDARLVVHVIGIFIPVGVVEDITEQA